MIPCIIIKYGKYIDENEITTLQYDNIDNLIKDVALQIRKFIEETIDKSSYKEYNTIDDVYERHWNEPYKTDCPFTIKFFHKNEWHSFDDDDIEKVWTNMIKDKNLNKLNELFEQEGKWIKIKKTDKLKKYIFKKYHEFYKNIDDMQIKVFNNCEKCDECLNNNYDLLESYYVEFYFKKNYYFITINIKKNNDDIKKHYIESNIDYSYYKDIGNILSSYFIITKTLSNYNFDFSQL